MVGRPVAVRVLDRSFAAEPQRAPPQVQLDVTVGVRAWQVGAEEAPPAFFVVLDR